jgi:hypothetical protein
MKTLAIALFLGLALLAGSAASAARGPAHDVLLGMVPHSGRTVTAARAARRPAASAAKAATCGISCADYETAVNQYFTDVAHDSGTTSNVYSVATQYFDTHGPIAYDVTFAGSIVDTNPYPASLCNDTFTGFGDKHCLTDNQLGAEIKKVIAAQSWPTGTANLYVILTPTDVGICSTPGSPRTGDDCSTNTFCAYHSNVPSGGSDVIYAVEPDDETIPTGGCDFGVQDPNSRFVDPTLNTLSHEHNEAITDPEGDAWFSNDFSEIGDLCAWTYGTPLGGDTSRGTAWNQVINGHNYWLQEEYSNAETAAGGCVQNIGGTASAPDPILHDGSGPLVYNGGAVMRTNTVRTIYWIPPALGVPRAVVKPRISGTAKVGRTLSATRGTWTNSPTKFRFQWLRCSARGTHCHAISGATKSKYKLVARDARHKLRVRVTAKNTVGSGKATSASTRTPVAARH